MIIARATGSTVTGMTKASSAMTLGTLLYVTASVRSANTPATSKGIYLVCAMQLRRTHRGALRPNVDEPFLGTTVYHSNAQHRLLTR
eukprot:scaffold259_cov158-Amphora_coffeaeformis.AAC.14